MRTRRGEGGGGGEAECQGKSETDSKANKFSSDVTQSTITTMTLPISSAKTF